MRSTWSVVLAQQEHEVHRIGGIGPVGDQVEADLLVADAVVDGEVLVERRAAVEEGDARLAVAGAGDVDGVAGAVDVEDRGSALDGRLDRELALDGGAALGAGADGIGVVDQGVLGVEELLEPG
jgi:hypothetical protein